MRNTIRKLIEKAFNLQDFESALEEEISSYIDYEEIARRTCENYADEIIDEAADLAEEYLPLI